MSKPSFGAAARTLSEPAVSPVRFAGEPSPGLAARFRTRASALLRDAGGATAIEYAMIGGLIFAVVAGSIRVYGSKVDAVYGRIGSAISQVN